ncbi:MAG: ABC transporter substrate-binding protein, partial [Treponema sp.]
MFKRFCLIGVFVAFVFASCNNSTKEEGNVAQMTTEHKKGIICDKVIFSVNMDETVALKDVVEGKQDVLFTRVPPAILNTLSDSDRDKLDIYTIPSGSWSLWLNPIPNKPPYTHKLNTGEVVFNPLALQKVRYAINWLIDRKKIINEVLGGDGDPMFTPMTPGQPGTYRYNLIPIKLGMSDSGDEKLAIDMITKALEEAAQLPNNKGKLVKNNKFWQYEGKDILVKFFIRVDDATGRLPAGRYIADQIEKAGIKVERLEWDRSRSSDSVYGANPADYICTMYTEGWSAGATRRWWDVTVCQMFAPFYGYGKVKKRTVQLASKLSRFF